MSTKGLSRGPGICRCGPSRSYKAMISVFSGPAFIEPQLVRRSPAPESAKLSLLPLAMFLPFTSLQILKTAYKCFCHRHSPSWPNAPPCGQWTVPLPDVIVLVYAFIICFFHSNISFCKGRGFLRVDSAVSSASGTVSSPKPKL